MLENILSVLAASVQLGLWCLAIALYVILGIQNRRHIARRWKPGLLLSFVLTLMLLPSTILGIVYLDTSELQQEMVIGLIFGVIIGIFIQVLKLAWQVLLFGVAEAEWQKTTWGAFLTPEAKRHPTWRELVMPFSIGVLAAIITTIIFGWLDVREGPIAEILQTFMPGLVDAPAAITIPATCLFLISAAISEELAFRGGILAYLLRVTRKSRALQWLAILLLNVPWALAHIPTTDHPVAKITQMMILGVVFTVLARNRSMRSAMAAHIGLNLASMALVYITGA